MDDRLDEIEITGLRGLEREYKWFTLHGVIGHGAVRLIHMSLSIQAFAWRQQDLEPVLRPGPWHGLLALNNGMVVQPMVRISPDTEGFVPASANISDWWTPAQAAGVGLVCFAQRWDPTRQTLAWTVTQVARIVSGEVFHMEAAPLSRRGRDWQAEAVTRGRLPAYVIPPVPDELLFLNPADDAWGRHDPNEIEFDVR